MMNRKPPKKARVGKKRGTVGADRHHRMGPKPAFYDIQALLEERHVHGRLAQFLEERVRKHEHTLHRLEECRKDRVFRLLEERFNNANATPEEVSRIREMVERFLSGEIRVFEYNALKKAFGLD